MTNAQYQNIPIHECGEPLIDLAKFSFVLEPAYYLHGLADTPLLYAREGVVGKLLRIQEQLGGLLLKIWDPWRSRIVQNNIYQKCWEGLAKQHPDWGDERLRIEVGVFVTAATDPNRIPPHATGGAIDLTLVDRAGTDIGMGTGFDHFGPEAAMFYFDEVAPDRLIADNRRLLREAMKSEGFTYYTEEWWHFDFGNQLWAEAAGEEFAIYGEKFGAP